MKEPMVIIEKDEKIPEAVLSWAEAHSVPVMTGEEDHAQNLKDSFHSETYENTGDFQYDYVIIYSEDITFGYLEMIYAHAHDIPVVITSTERLIIKEIGMDDLDIYKKLIDENPEAVSDNSLCNHTPDEFKERHRSYIKYSYHFLGYGIWGIFLKSTASEASEDSAKMIGIAGLDGIDEPSFSYALLKEYRRQGLTLEACKSILNFLIESLDIKDIRFNIRKDNIPSVGLAGKLHKLYPEAVRINLFD